MNKKYHVVQRDEETAAAAIEQFAKSNGQFLLPLLELVSNARMAVDEVITSLGRKTIETLLVWSAQEVASPQTPGKASVEIRWHGSQNGRVELADRRLKVKRPRLRHKAQGEVKVPAMKLCRKTATPPSACWERCYEESPRASMRRFCRKWRRPWECRAAASAAKPSRAAPNNCASCTSAAGMPPTCWSSTSMGNASALTTS